MRVFVYRVTPSIGCLNSKCNAYWSVHKYYLPTHLLKTFVSLLAQITWQHNDTVTKCVILLRRNMDSHVQILITARIYVSDIGALSCGEQTMILAHPSPRNPNNWFRIIGDVQTLLTEELCVMVERTAGKVIQTISHNLWGFRFSRCRVWRREPCELWRRVASQKLTDVSEKDNFYWPPRRNIPEGCHLHYITCLQKEDIRGS